MSTRAIIALPSPKGFITSWCWYDGGPSILGRELREYFKDESDVRQLLRLHSFSSILGPRAFKKFIMSDGDTAVVLSNLRVVLMHPDDGKVVAGKGKHGYFKTLGEMLGQDLNYVYVFKDGKWKTYGYKSLRMILSVGE